MAGIAGVVRSSPREGGEAATLRTVRRMISALRHRGPDGYGFYADHRAGLAHARIAGLDPVDAIGETGRLIAVFAGGLYNSAELLRELRGRGCRLRTGSDAELVVHGYEVWGRELLDRLDGQFALAIYERSECSLLLARDRFGASTLFLAERGGDLFFASEAKALFASGEVAAAPDLRGLDQVFTFWATRAPRTTFLGVDELEPGCWISWRLGRITRGAYYIVDYPEAMAEPEDALSRLDTLLREGVARRLGSAPDPGAYLSGGLDSGIICSLAASARPSELRTLSITFGEPTFDESRHQRIVAERLGTRHLAVPIEPGEVGAVFPEVVRHLETPALRTAPAPFFLLARRAREAGVGVVLSGEGADELFLGYDIFKETAVRRFALRQPHSTWRPRLFDRLYPYLGPVSRGGDFWRRSFLEAGPEDDPLFSHLPRFALTARIRDFYSPELRAELVGYDVLQELRDTLPPGFSGWSPLNRAAYLEMTILLPSYLLGSQGDRMAMAHGVTVRYPFLDHRLFEFAAALPVRSKLRVLREKEILRRWAAGLLPAAVAERAKQPYRAPDIPAFFSRDPPPPYLADLLDARALRDTGIFDSSAVAGLVRRCRSGLASGFRESQALVAIISTQLWHRAFIDGPGAGTDEPGHDINQDRARRLCRTPT